jgi:hypothetical protein
MLFDFGPQRYGVADIFAYTKLESIFFSFRQKKATLQNTVLMLYSLYTQQGSKTPIWNIFEHVEYSVK